MKFGQNNQITFTAKIFKELQLEPVDFLSAEIDGNQIILKPQKLISKDQAWFWTKEWQKKEKEADEDIKTGSLSGPFISARELTKHLDRLKDAKKG